MANEKDKLEQQIWYHGMRSRKDVTLLLINAGDFLLRATDTNMTTEIIISVKDDKGDIKHLTTKHDNDWWQLGVLKHKKVSAPKFKSVVELVEHYKERPLPGKIHLKRPIPRPVWLIKHEQVVFNKEKDLLGSGNFCHVYKGIYNRTPDISISVAVKLCHEGHAADKNFEEGKEARNAMLGEAELMNYYTHQHVIQLHGVACDHPPVLIVMEFCPGGNLESHLKKSGESISAGERLCYAVEASRGMYYLHSKNCIHRDLAARNCLISAEGRIKIADFGLSKIVKEDLKNKTLEVSPEDQVGPGVPLRWMAPESLGKKSIYSTKSDVWSFGVLMYEIFNNGIKPWPDETEWPPKRIATHIRKASMPDIPPKTPPKVVEVFQKIWVLEPDIRPSMKKLSHELHELLKVIEVPPQNKMIINTIAGVSRKSAHVEDSVELEEEAPKEKEVMITTETTTADTMNTKDATIDQMPPTEGLPSDDKETGKESGTVKDREFPRRPPSTRRQGPSSTRRTNRKDETPSAAKKTSRPTASKKKHGK